MMFRRFAVDFEAVQWTGDNLDEVRKFTGIRPDPHDTSEVQRFNPIGTYLVPSALEENATAEIWTDSTRMWRTVRTGEWIVLDNGDYIPVTDEWIRINCMELNAEMLELIRQEEEPKTFEDELVNLLNKHSMENRSGTPDFVLGEYLRMCLQTWDLTIKMRSDWRGERINSIFDIKQDDKVRITAYDSYGNRNEIGEAEITLWAGEMVSHGPVVAVVPIFAGKGPGVFGLGPVIQHVQPAKEGPDDAGPEPIA